MIKLPAIQKRILANWAKLFTGSTAGAALGMLAVIIMTHTIGVAEVGIVVVIQTFWRTLEGFLSFQSFQVLIKYGADMLHQKEKNGFRAVVKFCMLADIGIAVLGGLIGIIGFLLFYQRMEIPKEVVTIGLLGAATMLTMVSGAHLGILRLFDRFNIVAMRDVIVGLLRVGLNCIAFLLKAELHFFILIWIATEAFGNLLLVFYGFWELRKQGYDNIFKVSLTEQSLIKPLQILKSLVTINLATMIRVLTEEGDTLVVNAFTGPTGAGKYRIAKTFASISYKFMGPLLHSVYPEIAKIVSAGDKAQYNSVMKHTSLQGGLFGITNWLGWLLLGDVVIRLTVGIDYMESLTPILIITGGYAVSFFGAGLTPSLYAFHKLKLYLYSAIACTVIFFVVAIPLLPMIGINGAAWGQVACYMTGVLLNLLIVRSAYKRHMWST